MKFIIKLSPFAAANIKSMSSDKAKWVTEAIWQLQQDGIHAVSVDLIRLTSKQGYVVKVKSGIRLTVIEEDDGSLLVDDVFVNTEPRAKMAAGSTPHRQGEIPTYSATSAKRPASKKTTAGKTA